MAQQTKLRQQLRRKRLRRRRIQFILRLAVIAAVIIYIVGAVYYSKHFYGQRTVFGIEVRGHTTESLEEAIREKISAYKLDIATRDGVEAITADDIALIFDDQDDVEQMLDDQRALLWLFARATSKDDIQLSVAYDDEKMGAAINGLNCLQEENVESPTDAHLEFQEDAFYIVAETMGNELNYEKTDRTIRNAIKNGAESVDLDQLSCYVPPNVYENDQKLMKVREKANKMLAAKITYDFGDRSEVIDTDEIASWIIFGKELTCWLNEKKITEYVDKMGLKYDTFGLPRKFKTSYGTTITLKGGDYGWCINEEKTIAQLIDLIQRGEAVTTEPVYLYKGVCRDTNDIGNTYIEVSINGQGMWMYKDGKCIVSTPIVTGNVADGHDTPAGGVWAIDARMTNYTLSGQDYDADVAFWLPFNGDVGIHDASWREEFGGDIYQTNGSHGCVNTPYAAMKIIYENAKIGYPVIVY